MDDATLVSRAVGGDRDAFAAIYDRYGGAVLDLCTAVLRDGDEAAEATLDAFLRAARELVNLRDRSRLRLWLLAVARYEATVRAKRPRPAAAVAGGAAGAGGVGQPDAHTASADGLSAADPGADDPGADDTVADNPVADNPVAVDPGADDPRQQVWDPSQSLSDEDRTILHLHLRHQLDAGELGAVLGLRSATAGARAARLRRQAEGSVGALLLSRADGGVDPASCPGLTGVLDGWDGRFTAAVGARVDRHVRRCDVCRGRRTMLLDRLRAMASLPFLSPPDWLRREVLIRMELAVSPRPLRGWSEDGFPPGLAGPARRGRPAGRRRAAMASVAALVIVVLAGGGFLLLRDDGGPSTLTATGSSASTRPPVASTVTSTARGPAITAALTAPSVPPSPTPTSTIPGSGSSPGPGTGPTTTDPPGPGPTAPPIAVDRDPPAISFGADVASAYTSGCPYSVVGVSAQVADQSAVTWVALWVRAPEGGEVTVPMSSEGGGHWRATMGEFAVPGQAVFWVEAYDSEGNQARAADQFLDVFACE